jgi:hypothetical protein
LIEEAHAANHEVYGPHLKKVVAAARQLAFLLDVNFRTVRPTDCAVVNADVAN